MADRRESLEQKTLGNGVQRHGDPIHTFKKFDLEADFSKLQISSKNILMTTKNISNILRTKEFFFGQLVRRKFITSALVSVAETGIPSVAVIFPLGPQNMSDTKAVKWVEMNRMAQESPAVMWTGSLGHKYNFMVEFDARLMDFSSYSTNEQKTNGLENFLFRVEMFREPGNFFIQNIKAANNRSLTLKKIDIQFTNNFNSPPRAIFFLGDIIVEVVILKADIQKEVFTHDYLPLKASVDFELQMIDEVESVINRRFRVHKLQQIYAVEDPVTEIIEQIAKINKGIPK